MSKRRVVGLLVMTEIPEMGLVAVLQRRGEFNHEKMGPESFPGAMQLTVWGGMEETDTDELTAMLRECEEEMGGSFATHIRCWARLTVSEIYRFEDEKNLKVAYAVKLPCEFLKKICLGPSSGGIRLLKEEEIGKIQDLKNFDKTVGVTDRNILAMFADTKETIERAFKMAKI